MDTLAEMRTAVQSDLNVDDTSALYSPTIIDRVINRAYRKAGSLFSWPELMDAKKTTSENSNAYYDYPQAWQSNSIWKLVVDGDRYGEVPDGSPLVFSDYLNWQEDESTSTDKKWANQERRYFLSPVPANGIEICIWGKMATSALTLDGSVTIFSYHMDECNEAIILEAVAILKAKGDKEQSSRFKSDEARQILAVAWSKIRREKAKYEKREPFFNVPNFFGNTSNNNLTGRFPTQI